MRPLGRSETRVKEEEPSPQQQGRTIAYLSIQFKLIFDSSKKLMQ